LSGRGVFERSRLRPLPLVLKSRFVIVAAAAAPSGAEVAFRDRRGCGRFVSGRSRLRPLPLVLKSRFVIVAAAAASSLGGRGCGRSLWC
jgi:hypothetical protein